MFPAVLVPPSFLGSSRGILSEASSFFSLYLENLLAFSRSGCSWLLCHTYRWAAPFRNPDLLEASSDGGPWVYFSRAWLGFPSFSEIWGWSYQLLRWSCSLWPGFCWILRVSLVINPPVRHWNPSPLRCLSSSWTSHRCVYPRSCWEKTQ